MYLYALVALKKKMDRSIDRYLKRTFLNDYKCVRIDDNTDVSSITFQQTCSVSHCAYIESRKTTQIAHALDAACIWMPSGAIIYFRNWFSGTEAGESGFYAWSEWKRTSAHAPDVELDTFPIVNSNWDIKTFVMCKSKDKYEYWSD